MAGGNLKLYPELKPLTEKIRRHALWFQQYGVELRKKGGYKDYEVRFARDVLRKLVTTFEICEWYDRYDCDDRHITSLAIAACKKAGVL